MLTFAEKMKTTQEIKSRIQECVQRDLPLVMPEGVRNWISERIVEPYPTQLPVDPEGQQIEEFWIVSDHKNGKHYRIAYSPDSDSFGIVTPLREDRDWYMGDYGTFKQAVEGL